MQISTSIFYSTSFTFLTLITCCEDHSFYFSLSVSNTSCHLFSLFKPPNISHSFSQTTFYSDLLFPNYISHSLSRYFSLTHSLTQTSFSHLPTLAWFLSHTYSVLLCVALFLTHFDSYIIRWIAHG